jgi:tRNA (Thr-GGU) A37 N-methylase
MVDDTPVLDIKPYVTRLDQPAGSVRCGWFDTVTFNGAITPASLRPPE